MINFKERSREVEKMDDFEVGGEEIRRCLRELSLVHRLLGGRMQSLQLIQRIMEAEEGRPLHLVDVGCGGGDSLADFDKERKRRGWDLELTGVDANEEILKYCKERWGSASFHWKKRDIFSKAMDWSRYDIAHFGLVLHHFCDEEIQELIQQCACAGVSWIVVNDLQRSPTAYHAFRIFTRLLNFSKMSREDGKISIRKGFRKEEMDQFFRTSPYRMILLKKCWAFRICALAQLNP